MYDRKHATDAEITAAYYSLARRFHPDMLDQSEDKNQRFKDVVEAYEVLSDPVRRKQYDGQRARLRDSSPSIKRADSGEEVIDAVLPVSPEEALYGCTCQLRITRTAICSDCESEYHADASPCPTCQSTGRVAEQQIVIVEIPKSVRTGSILEVRTGRSDQNESSLASLQRLLRLRVVVRPCW